MPVLIWFGAVISLIGLIGIIWCILLVWRARRAGLDEDKMRAQLARVVPLNMGALVLSAIGLMMVVIGIILS